MLKIADGIDRKYKCADPSNYTLEFLDILMWGHRNRFIGIVLGSEVLILDFKRMASFRVNVSNLTKMSHKIDNYRRKSIPVDQSYMQNYFAENSDNPYALWNVLKNMGRDDILRRLTQLPPLYYKKDAVQQTKSIKQMCEVALPGDILFTFDRSSGLHNLIRKYDKGMFGHVAMVSDTKTIHESTLSGIIESSFSELDDPSLDVALYRVHELTDDQRAMAANNMASLVGMTGYDWYKVIRIFLWKRFRIPLRKDPYDVTPADLIYANQMQLICYA